MPTYDYLCAKCGPLEVFQSMREDALSVCPECGSKRFQRQVSRGAGVIFKGAGFYETDYNRSSDYQTAAKQEQGAACGGGCACHPAASASASATASAAEAKPVAAEKPAPAEAASKPAKAKKAAS